MKNGYNRPKAKNDLKRTWYSSLHSIVILGHFSSNVKYRTKLTDFGRDWPENYHQFFNTHTSKCGFFGKVSRAFQCFRVGIFLASFAAAGVCATLCLLWCRLCGITQCILTWKINQVAFLYVICNILTHFDFFWLIWAKFDSFWLTLTQVISVWISLIQFGLSLIQLDSDCLSWLVLTHFDSI